MLTVTVLRDELLEGRAIATAGGAPEGDRKSTRLNSSHDQISYAVFCLKKKNIKTKPSAACTKFGSEVTAFPEYYKPYLIQAIIDGAVSPLVSVVGNRPGNYRGDHSVTR